MQSAVDGKRARSYCFFLELSSLLARNLPLRHKKIRVTLIRVPRIVLLSPTRRGAYLTTTFRPFTTYTPRRIVAFTLRPCMSYDFPAATLPSATLSRAVASPMVSV